METFVRVYGGGTPQSFNQHPRKRSVSKQDYKDIGGVISTVSRILFFIFSRSIPVSAEGKKKDSARPFLFLKRGKEKKKGEDERRRKEKKKDFVQSSYPVKHLPDKSEYAHTHTHQVNSIYIHKYQWKQEFSSFYLSFFF